MVVLRSPLLDPAQHLSTRRMAMLRALALTGAQVDTRTVANGARALADAREDVADLNDLLARPQ